MRNKTNRVLRKKVLLMLLLSGFVSFTMAQSQVRGIITDKDGKPLPGVTVTVKWSTNATTTGDDGRFTITASPKDVLAFTSASYNGGEVKVGNSTNISFTLNEKVNVLDDVVVVGYGTQRRGDLTGSIVGVNINETKKYSTSDITQLLQGRVA